MAMVRPHRVRVVRRRGLGSGIGEVVRPRRRGDLIQRDLADEEEPGGTAIEALVDRAHAPRPHHVEQARGDQDT